MTTAKQTIATLLNQLPDDCTLEDIQYHLYVLTKVQQGLDTAKSQGTIPPKARAQSRSRK